jgi:hypothetical protein
MLQLDRKLIFWIYKVGNNKGESITVPLTSCLTGLNKSVLQTKTKIVSCHTADSKPVKLEVNGTEILPPLVSSIQGESILSLARQRGHDWVIEKIFIN